MIALVSFATDPSAGGIQNTAYWLADSFAEQDDESFLLFTGNDSIIPANVKAIQILINNDETYGLFKKAIRILNCMFHHKEIEISLCFHWTIALPCMLYRSITHVSYSVMVYGNEIMKECNNNIKTRLRQKVRSCVLDKASCIFACSEYTKQLCTQICKNKNIIVIHPPVHFTERSASASAHTYIILSLGRHVERKGFQDVIQAMPKLRQLYPQICYRLAGDGPYHAELVQLAKELGVSNCVEFLGKISEEQKQKELQNCDLFIMTSHIDEEHCEVEGFGVCYLEANAYGKWVIARNSGGVSDAVVDGVTGRLLPDSDVDSICNAVKEFYEMSDFDPEKVRAWAALHSPDNIAKQYLECLKKYAKQ